MTATRGPAWIAATVAAVVALSAVRTARADRVDPKRSVAILEYRGGSSAVPELDERVRAILTAKTSLAVLGPDAARERYGDRLDAHVARCRGDAACVARIGGRLEVAEVLLVGVSEFGDVIVTLQRISVGSGAVTARVAEALAPGASPDPAAIEQYLRRVLPEADFVRWGRIVITANLDGAIVYVDEAERGTTPVQPLRVRAPNKYDIRVTKDGYVPFEAEVVVPPDAEVEVKPVLSLRGTDVAWYKRWWVVALAGTVAAGVAVGVVAVGARDDDVSVVVNPFSLVRF